MKDRGEGLRKRILFVAGKLVLRLLLIVAVIGCGSSTPTVTDLSKAPWLDPKVQSEGLKSNDRKVRSLSANNLGNIGAPAADAIPALEKLAQSDPEPQVRDLAKQAVEKIRAASGSQ